eukprot:610088-Rhodomonas_salina.2
MAQHDPLSTPHGSICQLRPALCTAAYARHARDASLHARRGVETWCSWTSASAYSSRSSRSSGRPTGSCAKTLNGTCPSS